MSLNSAVCRCFGRFFNALHPPRLQGDTDTRKAETDDDHTERTLRRAAQIKPDTAG